VGVGRRDRAPRRLSAEIAGHLVAALNDDRIWMAERSLLTCMDHRVEVVIWLLEVAAALEPAGHRSTDERGKTAVPNVTRTCRSRFSCGRQLWVESGPEAEQKIRLKSDHDQAAMERLEPVFRVL
jgi:hypothetical protein